MDFLGLLGLFGSAASAQVSALASWAVDSFATMFGNVTAVATVLGNFIKWATSALASIVSFLSGLWAWLRDSILKKIIAVITSIHDWLKKIFKPLTDWINQYRLLLRQLFNQYVKPILNFLQSVRRVLYVFRLLGFKWAKALDARIVRIEQQLETAFLGTWANLNRLADWVNFIVDPFGLFSPRVWLGSVFRSAGALIAILQHAQLSNPPAYTATDQAADDKYFSIGHLNAMDHLRATTGPLPEDLAEQQDLQLLYAADGF